MAVVLNNQQDNENQNNQQQQQVATGGSEAPTPSGGAAPPSNSAPGSGVPSGSQPQGSGRYNNLQKYIQANQGAGQRLTSGIGQQIGRTFDVNKKEAQNQAQAIGQNIQQGKDTLARGTGYSEQLQGPDFNAQQFAGNQNQLQDFTKFRFGQNVDENALGQQKQNLDVANQSAMQNIQNRVGQVGDEQGRFGLLKEAFGGRGLNTKPQYGAGQQRLDQLFLQAGGGNNVNALQNIVQGKIGEAQGLQTQAGQLGQNIQGLTADEAALQNKLTGQAQGLESGYIDALGNKVASVNTERDAQRKQYQDFFNTLTGKAPNTTLNQDLFGKSGLQLGQQSYNVLNDPNLTVQQIADISARNAQSYKDVAGQKDVDYYKSLAQLSKGSLGDQGQYVGPQESQMLLTKAGDLDEAAKFKTDDSSLTNRLARARQNFINEAAGTTLTGTGKEGYSGGLFGGNGESTEYAYGNVGDLLSRANPNYAGGSSSAGSPGIAGISGAGSNALLSNPALTTALLGPAGAYNGAALGAISNISSMLGGGDSAGAERAARAKANQDLDAQINSYLKQKGFGNVVTTGGAKDTSNITDQQVALNNEYQKNLRQNEQNLSKYDIGKVQDNPYINMGGGDPNIIRQLTGKLNTDTLSGELSGWKKYSQNLTDEDTQKAKSIMDQAKSAYEGGTYDQLLGQYAPQTRQEGLNYFGMPNNVSTNPEADRIRNALTGYQATRNEGAGIKSGYDTRQQSLNDQLQALINPNVWKTQV